jgi:hypothetical protein
MEACDDNSAEQIYDAVVYMQCKIKKSIWNLSQSFQALAGYTCRKGL